MILIGLGGNLHNAQGDAPRVTLEHALRELNTSGVAVLRQSRWYETAPVPASDQPNFVNAVVSVASSLDPPALLMLLHRIEAAFGRVHAERNAARTIDLDLLGYDEVLSDGPLLLPHPRLHERAFVLLPLQEITPDWRHPRLGSTVAEMIAALSPDQKAHPLER